MTEHPAHPPFPGAPTPEQDARALYDQAVQLPIEAEQTVYEGRIWDVVSERFHFAGDQLTRDFVAHTGAVAILALDENDRVLCIRQYRHPVRLREWEIPAGLLDIEGEPALETAKRELAEEVDLQADHWSVLTDYLTSPGGSNEIVRIFVARGLHQIVTDYEREGEELELELRWVDFDEAVAAVLENRVMNSIFKVAILTANAMRQEGWKHLQPGDAPWPMRAWRNRTLDSHTAH